MMHSSHTSWATVAFILAFMLGATLNDEEYKMNSKEDVQSDDENPQHAPLASETSAMNEEPHTTTPIFDFTIQEWRQSLQDGFRQEKSGPRGV